ncbi:MAG: DUF1330 domain-containing protein [Alphaproteobacteria bacterium]|nr:DUF1330 domain-containing protein [Alphaproteobacteria bacterium]MBU1513763.1 DUF1330 domain-containing protein [Alphaproteobacteria bacterium]MBU2094592.1 DUF1330 domain-containing protein [Alphaproteobacteria bacterium]MBU2150339.1 DUF1330 domain-containing protein [Alphaproteobacteria bacterium]MBU2309132.1 DUF1330 domain-containing protein [Alphaproteobacteria bacterium]
MPAYLISDLIPREAPEFQQYRSLAAEAIRIHGGRYIARGGGIEVLEGDWSPTAVVMVEFPDMATARAWYASPAYAKALAVRDKALSRNLILVDGAAIAP